MHSSFLDLTVTDNSVSQENTATRSGEVKCDCEALGAGGDAAPSSHAKPPVDFSPRPLLLPPPSFDTGGEGGDLSTDSPPFTNLSSPYFPTNSRGGGTVKIKSREKNSNHKQ